MTMSVAAAVRPWPVRRTRVEVYWELPHQVIEGPLIASRECRSSHVTLDL